MKLYAYRQQVEFPLQKDCVNHLVIENPQELDRFVRALDESHKKRSQDVELVEEDVNQLINHTQILYSPLECQYDKRQIIKKLYLSLAEAVENSDLIDEYLDMKAKMFELLDKIYLDSDCEIEGDDDLTLELFFKNANIHLKDPEGNFVDRLMEFSWNVHRLLGKHTIILVGCQHYIGLHEYEDILKQFSYEDMTLLMVDGRQLEGLNVKVNEYIIDKDLCVLY